MSESFKKRSNENNNLLCLHAGFGDAINCDESWRACCSYIDEQFRQYFTDESGLNRKNIQDNRVHCCLYFVPPYGHGYVQTLRRESSKFAPYFSADYHYSSFSSGQHKVVSFLRFTKHFPPAVKLCLIDIIDFG